MVPRIRVCLAALSVVLSPVLLERQMSWLASPWAQTSHCRSGLDRLCLYWHTSCHPALCRQRSAARLLLCLVRVREILSCKVQVEDALSQKDYGENMMML